MSLEKVRFRSLLRFLGLHLPFEFLDLFLDLLLGPLHIRSYLALVHGDSNVDLLAPGVRLGARQAEPSSAKPDDDQADREHDQQLMNDVASRTPFVSQII